ncbi:hypothetical protein INT47_007293 [Mucor saturninus]|uniref:Uncharacterized protein n=1 Tax=Mucor saturninus TaxID=64648 RepID=A0A8H7R7W5_9FUNG|nr:hypothetical protein INT47_007293 [Mucor saturninus]
MNSGSSPGKTSAKYSNISERQYWIRPTYYTPPSNHMSKIPMDLYGFTPANDVLDKLMKASYLTDDEYTSGLTHHDICAFGWLKKGDRFYNVHSKEFSDKHYCCQ